MANNSMVGTQLKINVHFDEIDGYNMDSYDFKCEFYTQKGKSVTVDKSSMTRIDSQNYLAIVDTTVTGYGDVFMRATAYIPDTDCPDGRRVEVSGCSTGITIAR